MLRVPDPIPFSGYQSDTFFSPSLAIGMSTPPPSQRNTPAANVLENSSSTHAPSGKEYTFDISVMFSWENINKYGRCGYTSIRHKATLNKSHLYVSI